MAHNAYRFSLDCMTVFISLFLLSTGLYAGGLYNYLHFPLAVHCLYVCVTIFISFLLSNGLYAGGLYDCLHFPHLAVPTGLYAGGLHDCLHVPLLAVHWLANQEAEARFPACWQGYCLRRKVKALSQDKRMPGMWPNGNTVRHYF